MTISKKVKNLVLNQKVAVDYLKSKTFIVDNVEVKDDFFIFNLDDRRITVYKEYITFLSYDSNKKNHRIVINHPHTTLGFIEEITDKFILLKITDTKINKDYHNIIPIKCLRGIKSYDFDGETQENEYRKS